MELIPRKLYNQLCDIVNKKFVISYRPTKDLRINNYNTTGFAVDPHTVGKLCFFGPNGAEEVVEQTKSVAKTLRRMEIKDLFNNAVNSEFERLQYLFELEKEVEELRKLKQSVETIKDMFKKEDK